MPTTSNDILISARGVEVAAKAKKPTVSILAYTGGIMDVPGWGLIAIDVSGLELAGRRVGILADHDATLGGIVAQGQAEARDGKLLVMGTLSETTDSAKRVLRLAKDGFEFQASVGVEPIEKKRIRSGDSVDVNGRTLTAPERGFTLIEKGKLREVSIVALAADEETSVAIAASRRKGNEDMETELKRVRAEERERMTYIEAACNPNAGWGKDADRVADLKVKAIEGELSVEELQAKLLHIVRSSRPAVGPVIIRGSAGHTEVIEASLLRRMGHGSLAEKTLGERACEQANGSGAAHMLDLCRTALQAEGVDVPQGRMEMVKAALSTYSLPAALGNVANKLLLQTYEESPATWRAFCQPRSVSDFKPNTAIRPSFTGQLEQVAPGGKLKHGSVDEKPTVFAVDTFGKLFGIDRRDLVNDDLSVFDETARALGKTAMRKVSDLV